MCATARAHGSRRAGWLLKVQVGGAITAELGALLTPAKYEDLCHAAH